jgi:hypothetical protein
VDPIQPIARSDRTVQPVDLPRLRALERDREQRRGEREKQRRERGQSTPPASQKRGAERDGGLDVRA